MSGVEHLGFIVAAYAVAGGVVLLTIAMLVLDNLTQKRLLARFSAQEDDAP